jgi:uncharacterized NAD-dependent epimerase/dehydratase family protein
LAELIHALEVMAALARPHPLTLADNSIPISPPPRVRAIALNTGHLGAVAAAEAIAATADRTGLPCHDPVRAGGSDLLEALLEQPD